VGGVGEVWCWGLNDSMRLGLGEGDMTERFAPERQP
jgi:hypothetical protein